MEASVIISLRCKDKAHRDFVRLMLSDDADRPIFEEDVAESQREWFFALEDIDSAEWVVVKSGWGQVLQSRILLLHLTYE